MERALALVKLQPNRSRIRIREAWTKIQIQKETGWYLSIKIVKFKTVEMDLVSLVIKDLAERINFQMFTRTLSTKRKENNKQTNYRRQLTIED